MADRTALQPQAVWIAVFFFFFLPLSSFTSNKNEKSIATAAWESGACWGQLLGWLAGTLTKQENGLQIAVCIQMSRVPWSIDYMFGICEGQQWLSVFLVPASHVGLSPILLLCPATVLSCHSLLFSIWRGEQRRLANTNSVCAMSRFTALSIVGLLPLKGLWFEFDLRERFSPPDEHTLAPFTPGIDMHLN